MPMPYGILSAEQYQQQQQAAAAAAICFQRFASGPGGGPGGPPGC